jgi:transposase
MVCEPLAGRREILVQENHNRLSWAEVVRYVAEEMYPHAKRITLVQDNLAAHKPSALYEIMPAERARQILRRLEVVWTPKHGSWLNVAEIELGVLKRVGLSDRVGSEEELSKQLKAYQKARNAKEVKVNWQFRTTDARVKLKRLYPSFEP